MRADLWRRLLCNDNLTALYSRVGVQEEGHPPGARERRFPAPMSKKPAGRVPPSRVALWSLIALLLVAGVVLYFQFGADVTPMAERLR